MILVDTSVWIDHLRRNDPVLREILHRQSVVMHPFVIGEIAMGSLKNRALLLKELSSLPMAVVAEEDEVLQFAENHKLYGSGIGYLDAHLLTSTRMTFNTLLWTRDSRLRAISSRLSLAFPGSLN